VIIVCPRCGANNRIPTDGKASRAYRCGRCKATLDQGLNNAEIPAVSSPAGRPEEIASTDVAGAIHPAANKSLLAAICQWFTVGESRLVVSLALIALVLHLCVVPYGSAPIFDEGHYVPEALSIIHQGQVTHPEHPPLGKLFIASGIIVLGDNPWGWRMPSVVFGVASVVIFYFICRRLAGRLAALLATVLLVFETLTFIFSGLAMLDVFSLTFMLLAFLLYLQNRHVLSGVSLALSGLCKMTGLLGVLVILLHWALSKRRGSARDMGLLILCASVALLVLMPLLDFAATREWLSPIGRISYMLTTHEGKTFAELPPEKLAFASYPWEWVLSPMGYRAADYRYLCWISPTVWILIIPSMCYMVYERVRNKTEVSLFALLWFAATYLVWIPLVALTDRQTFLFYFYPTVGAVCIAIGFALKTLWDIPSQAGVCGFARLAKVAVAGYLALHAVFFLALGPLLPALASY
jgi:predicted membrane-bound dolichyl-phosphate-mannose-protein mannosyltransferase